MKPEGVEEGNSVKWMDQVDQDVNVAVCVKKVWQTEQKLDES